MANNSELQQIYSLAPMQEGMLFHALMNKDSHAYFEQIVYGLEGAIDNEIYEQAWNTLIASHDIFRTNFFYEETNQPMQIVFKEKKAVVYFEDISNLTEDDRVRVVAQYQAQDRQKGFDLNQDILIRAAVFEIGINQFQIIWSFHHMLLDGWSLGIIFREFFDIYQHIQAKEAVSLKEKTPFGHYIKWLKKQDREAGYEYWRQYLADYEQPALLPGRMSQPKRDGFYQQQALEFQLGTELTDNLSAMAQKYRVTVNIIFQTVWGILLQKYNNTEDVVYGTVVSGRPAQIPGIDSAVGLFINTIPVRIKNNQAVHFTELIRKVQDNALLSEKYNYLSLAQIQAQTSLKNQLFDQIIAFENYPLDRENGNRFGAFTVSGLEAFEQTNYDFNITVIPGNPWRINFSFNRMVYQETAIDRIKNQLLQILAQITTNFEKKIADLTILTPAEKERILMEFNQTDLEYPRQKTITQLFEEQVAKTPDHPAVIFGVKGITYLELNQKANQLGRLLREKGVKPDCFVGVMVQPSVEMMIGALAVLKAGGAYLPIDPAYPGERIKYMLDESNTQILLSHHQLTQTLQFDGEIIDLEDPAVYQSATWRETAGNPEPVNQPKDLAYLIFTSGSTGKPKGVMVEHCSLANLCSWHNNYYEISDKDRCTKYAGWSFDASVWEIFPYLITGAAIYIVDETIKLDSAKLCRFMIENQITISFLPTQVCEQLMQLGHIPVPKLLTGGDKLRSFHPGQFTLYNNYGPTENTVVTTSCKVTEALDNIPIGRPIGNTKVYILNQQFQPQAIGTPGELCIGGESLARGYLNNPELTATKFVPNPFYNERCTINNTESIIGECLEPEQFQTSNFKLHTSIIYRTGDYGRWLPDGNIEFLGRIDHQVKIRGFRIELGEIESLLLKHEGVHDAVVTVREDQTGNKYLIAYLVAATGLDPAEMRTYLMGKTPEYMIPSYFISLRQFPLTPNGKIDRHALPDPDLSLKIHGTYSAPTNEVEETLATIWQNVLGVNTIGIHDNFFELGGDSIKVIQVAAQLNRHQLKMQIQDLFKNPTIAQLAKQISFDKNEISQDTVHGEVALTPIQRLFFEQDFPDKSHFNQTLLLERNAGFDESVIRQVFTKLLEHHDVLRMVFRTETSRVIQYNRGLEGELYRLTVFDLTQGLDVQGQIERIALQMNSGITLSTGPLVNLALFKTHGSDKLLIIIHHLVVDGVSWRILLEDFTTGYQSSLRHQGIQFPPKTHSFQEWSLKLREYAQTKELLKEKEYWRKFESTRISQSVSGDENHEGSPNTSPIRKSCEVKLPPAATENLLKRVNKAYHTEINDLLLTALGLAVKQTTGVEQFLISLEGHGREEIIPGMNINRTIGWFTAIYPVLLDMTFSEDIDQIIKYTKESLRQIPNHGIGYGILKYLAENNSDVNWTQNPEISFNYLGQFARDEQDRQNELALNFGPIESSFNQELNRFRASLEIVGMVIAGELVFKFDFDTRKYSETISAKLTDVYRNQLLQIIDHCSLKETDELTPSDFDNRHLSIAELDQLTAIYGTAEIQHIYSLSPLQEGMLFHAITEPDAPVYFEQTAFVINGPLDLGRFEASFNALIAKYDILRTIFVYQDLAKPQQIVLRERKTTVYAEDLSKLSPDTQMQAIENYQEQDKRKGFDLAEDALIRVATFWTGAERYKVVWSFHHILMDGWCMGIIIKEFFEIYHSLQTSQPLQLEEACPYGAYIKWLEKQDQEAGYSYWQEALASYDKPAWLLGRQARTGAESYQQKQLDFQLDPMTTKKLTAIAHQYHVTVNTVFQTLWGILLQRYNNTGDVVFGTVVSGRPAQIAGIDQAVGLFINTIPVRIQSAPNQNFPQLLNQVQERALAAEQYSYLSLAQIQNHTPLKQKLFDHILVFENYPLNRENDHYFHEFNITDLEAFEQTNYDFNLIIVPGDQYRILFNYNAAVYPEPVIQRVKEHYCHIFGQINDHPEILIADLAIVTPAEKERLLVEFNNTQRTYPGEKTLHELFAEQAARTPENIALIYVDWRTASAQQIVSAKQMTYQELNEKANQVAKALQDRGVTPDSIVGIMTDRSFELVIGIIGILKAGGAYLPIDPDYPQERIKFMLENSQAKILLTQSHLRDNAAFFGEISEIVDVNDEKLYARARGLDKRNPVSASQPQNLAYIIYTSGTTGQPKGVMIEHRSITNTIRWRKAEYRFTPQDTVLQLFSSSFDGFLTSAFTPLVSGARLCILNKDSARDPMAIKNTISAQQITHFISVPTLYQGILECAIPDELKSLRIVTLAGEAITPEIVKRSKAKNASLEIVNEYGPTENSVATTVKRNLDGETQITIGTPVANTKVYILNGAQLSPVNGPGEICIAGAGLARGYIGNSELTAEKFMANPFEPGQRMYRTGDLARWLPEGEIEFLGRIDHQVKIRGFRIELGEIESRLLTHEAIKEAVVIAKENIGVSRKDTGVAKENSGTFGPDGSARENIGGANYYLCAYFSAERELTITELREYLLKELPDYMVPSYFVQLEKLPLTPNGKIDRKELASGTGPESDGSMNIGVAVRARFEAPRNEIEQTLAAIWQDVLKVDRIGIHDHFFELGGDSIKAIQVSARLNKFHLKMEIKDLFKQPTIMQLAKQIQPDEEEISQATVSGTVHLTPVQCWFYEQPFSKKAHFNQSIMLYRAKRFDETILRRVFDDLVSHHDALRMVYRRPDDQVIQFNREIEGELYQFEVIDLKSQSDYRSKIEIHANRLQQSIDLTQGPLVKIGLFKTPDGDHLLIIIHHLVVDGISWRIILEDLTDGYQNQLAGKTSQLPAKTHSFQEWAAKLVEYSNSKEFLKAIKYWRRLEEQAVGVLPKHEIQQPDATERKVNRIKLSPLETENLLKRVNAAYNTETNDILLTALVQSLKAATGQETVLIQLEGHGREAIMSGINISRTVGWFTSIYPVILDITNTRDLGYTIKHIKESLRRIPHHGIGYGILKYLTKPENRPELEFKLKPEISFNYLGQFDQDFETGLFSRSKFAMGEMASAEFPRLPLEINGMELDGQLELTFDYAAVRYPEDLIAKLCDSYREILQQIIDHCIKKVSPEYTPADFEDNDISIEELENLEKMVSKL